MSKINELKNLIARTGILNPKEILRTLELAMDLAPDFLALLRTAKRCSEFSISLGGPAIGYACVESDLFKEMEKALAAFEGHKND